MHHHSAAPAPGAITGDVRRRILADPEIVLSDPALMRALVDRADAPPEGNVVDMRGLAMARLEERLSRLEETHRSVIAAAYENLAGTGQIHRAVLRMLDATDFETFLSDLVHHVAPLLRVESIVLAVETTDAGAPMPPPLRAVPQGFVGRYVTRGRGGPVRQVTLRQMPEGDDGLHADDAGAAGMTGLGGGASVRGGFGAEGHAVASEACLSLDLGEGRLPALLALGCEDPHQFRPGQGTDLLAFFAGTFERALRRWLG